MAKAEENKKGAKLSFKERCVNFFKGIGRSFKNMFHEMKKVSWPSKKELINYSVLVLVFMLVMGVIIGLFDVGAGALVNLIVSL